MSKRVTAIGEILYDVYPDQKRLGGAPFNFIYHVSKITGKGNFISSVGEDEMGAQMLAHLNERGFDTSYISHDASHPTGSVNVRIDSLGIPKFTISGECSYDYITLDEHAGKLISEGTDLLYFGTLSQRSEITRNTIESLYGRSFKYFCDLNLRHNFFSKKIIEKCLTASSLIKINSDELKIVNRHIYDDKESTDIIPLKILNDFSLDIVCVTSGAEGARIYTKDESDSYKVQLNNPVDTLGAGDAYSAILCLGYLEGMPVKEINKLANMFAAEICMINGALPDDESIYDKYRKIFGTD